MATRLFPGRGLSPSCHALRLPFEALSLRNLLTTWVSGDGHSAETVRRKGRNSWFCRLRRRFEERQEQGLVRRDRDAQCTRLGSSMRGLSFGLLGAASESHHGREGGRPEGHQGAMGAPVLLCLAPSVCWEELGEMHRFKADRLIWIGVVGNRWGHLG